MKYSPHFPVAIALTKDHGWQAIYEDSQCRGVTFDAVFWLREPSKELGIMADTCVNPNSGCIQAQNLLVPSIFRKIDQLKITKVSLGDYFLERTKND